MNPVKLICSVFGMLLATSTCSARCAASTIIAETTYPASDLGNGTFRNPVIWADVPDLCVIRVDSTYYMVSTTMHMSPGIPVMRSYDLVNWEIINYCYPQLETTDAFALKNGKNDYAAGSWASNIRYDKTLKRFFVITACQSTGKSYIFSTSDIVNGPWHRNDIEKCYDPGLLLEGPERGNRRWVLYGQQRECYREIFVDEKTFDVTLGPEMLWKEVCDHEGRSDVWVEGAQSLMIGNEIYLFMISLRDGRTQIVWRGKDINDPDSWQVRRVFYKGQIINVYGTEVMPSSGIAQGAIVDTPDGKWYALLFQDNGAVGRIPVLIPVTWTDDGWPVLGNNGETVNEILPKPGDRNAVGTTDIVTSDNFDNGTRRLIIREEDTNSPVTSGITIKDLNKIISDNAGNTTAIDSVIAMNEYGYNGSNLKLQWQWNHNPNNNLWSLTDRKGWLRLKGGIRANNIREARNTLTQRTFGPQSSAVTYIDASGMKDGDYAGLTLFANRYGYIGITMRDGTRYIQMRRATAKDDAGGKVIAESPLKSDKVYLKADCDFGYDKRDTATFSYSMDGKSWTRLGDTLKMVYEWPDFMGYRFGLFYYPTCNLGGHADFDYFRVSY